MQTAFRARLIDALPFWLSLGMVPLALIAMRWGGWWFLLMPLYACRRWQGTPQPREGQELAWVRAADLARYPMPPADLPLVPILRDWL